MQEEVQEVGAGVSASTPVEGNKDGGMNENVWTKEFTEDFLNKVIDLINKIRENRISTVSIDIDKHGCSFIVYPYLEIPRRDTYGFETREKILENIKSIVEQLNSIERKIEELKMCFVARVIEPEKN